MLSGGKILDFSRIFWTPCSGGGISRRCSYPIFYCILRVERPLNTLAAVLIDPIYTVDEVLY